jgi:hypothetical protein
MTVHWWASRQGRRRHAVAAGRALCGVIPLGGWQPDRVGGRRCGNCARVARLVPVVSSNVQAIAHSARRRELTAHFHNGGRYRYYDVPRATFEALLTADSVGSAFAAAIKDGGYRFAKWTGAPPAKRSREV